jgi:hypothetical protein
VRQHAAGADSGRWAWKVQRVPPRDGNPGAVVVHVWDCPDAPAGDPEVDVYEALDVLRSTAGPSRVRSCGAAVALGPLPHDDHQPGPPLPAPRRPGDLMRRRGCPDRERSGLPQVRQDGERLARSAGRSGASDLPEAGLTHCSVGCRCRAQCCRSGRACVCAVAGARRHQRSQGRGPRTVTHFRVTDRCLAGVAHHGGQPPQPNPCKPCRSVGASTPHKAGIDGCCIRQL